MKFRLAMIFCAYCLAHRAVVRYHRISSQMLRSIAIAVVFYSIDTCMHLICYLWLFSDWDGGSSEQFSKALISKVVSALLIFAQLKVTLKYCRESTRFTVIEERIELRELPRASQGEQPAEAETSLSTSPAQIAGQTQHQELPVPITMREGQAADIVPPMPSTSAAQAEGQTQPQEPPLELSPILSETEAEPSGETGESTSTTSQRHSWLGSILRSRWLFQRRSLPHLD